MGTYGRSMLYDMHCHLDWFANATAVARNANALDLGIFATTVTPSGFERAAETFRGARGVVVGVGLHPWWVADGRCGDDEVRLAAELASASRFVGEVGLDFSASHVPEGSRRSQVDALRRVLAACDAAARAQGPKLVSLHAVRSADTVLDLLDETGCTTSCRPVLHWFSGTSDELARARRLGCHFSVGEMMLRSRRGREYARQLPANRLLLETDLPPSEGAECAAADVAASLQRTLDTLCDLRGEDLHGIAAENSRRLLCEAGWVP